MLKNNKLLFILFFNNIILGITCFFLFTKNEKLNHLNNRQLTYIKQIEKKLMEYENINSASVPTFAEDYSYIYITIGISLALLLGFIALYNQNTNATSIENSLNIINEKVNKSFKLMEELPTNLNENNKILDLKFRTLQSCFEKLNNELQYINTDINQIIIKLQIKTVEIGTDYISPKFSQITNPITVSSQQTQAVAETATHGTQTPVTTVFEWAIQQLEHF